jgi:hypothetical protein
MRFALLVSVCLLCAGCNALSQRVYDAEQAGELREGMTQADLEAIVGRPPHEREDAIVRYGDVVEWTPQMQWTHGYGRLYTFRLRSGVVESISVRDDGQSWLQIRKRPTSDPAGSELGPG